MCRILFFFLRMCVKTSVFPGERRNPKLLTVATQPTYKMPLQKNGILLLLFLVVVAKPAVPGNIPRRVSRGREVIHHVRVWHVRAKERVAQSAVDEDFELAQRDHLFTVFARHEHRRERDVGEAAKVMASAGRGVL